jgi:hypothetical protein
MFHDIKHRLIGVPPWFLWHPGLTDLQHEELWALEVHLPEATDGDHRVSLETFAPGGYFLA